MRRRDFLTLAGGSLITTFAGMKPLSGLQTDDDVPNILIIIGDDCTYSDLPLYGGHNVETPYIERLADQGMTFNHAYQAMAMCMPTRSELYTGLYPMENGACWNHSGCHPGTKSMVHYLGERGYRVGLTGKKHVRPQVVFPFEPVPGVEGSAVSQTAKFDPEGIREFMTRDPEQPFALSIGLAVPHMPWTVGEPDSFNPEEFELPPYLVDTAETREDFAKYLAEITVLDRQVGAILGTLEETGQAENTIVIFTSEQGAQFSGCKWTNWNQGVQTGFIVRWPGKITAGERTDAMIQYADVLPTLLDAAGAEFPGKEFSGSSFLPVLLGEKSEHREYVYHMHNNVPEGPPYPIRSVRTKEYHYIRNLLPERTYIEKHLMGKPERSPYWVSWLFESANNEHAYNMIHRYMHRPAEHLYHTTEDEHELSNLAEDPQYAEIKQHLSDALDRWMEAQGDPGKSLDTWESLEARREEARGSS